MGAPLHVATLTGQRELPTNIYVPGIKPWGLHFMWSH